jgi:hypothetical protein
MRGSTAGELHALAAFSHQLNGIKERFAQAEWLANGAPDGVGVLRLPAASIFIDEWDMLMRAVQERLSLIATGAPQQGHLGLSQPLPACVLECVQALQQLHGLLLHASPRPTSAERRGPADHRLRVRASGATTRAVQSQAVARR